MPFKSVKQELAMRINAPKVWKAWVKKYGHAPGYYAAVKGMAKRAARTRRRGSK